MNHEHTLNAVHDWAADVYAGGLRHFLPVYLCGPMRGKPELNFPLFNGAAGMMESYGLEVLNPAEAFDGQRNLPIEDYVRHDLLWIIQRAKSLLALPGWRSSRIGNVEMLVCGALGLPCYEITPDGAKRVPFTPLTDSLAHEAWRLVNYDRGNDYGPPQEDFARTAAMFNALLGVSLDPWMVALFMVCVKMSREANKHKRDNIRDAIGYLLTMDMCAGGKGDE